ncbi:hypothetical protein ACVWZM_002673 [Bradyrhizobium sp. USDA 4501]
MGTKKSRATILRRVSPGGGREDAMTEAPAVPAAKTAAAYHEAGHAVASMVAFRTAKLPMRPPKRIIKFIEITAAGGTAWGGLCFGPDIYAIEWPEARIDPIYREAMEWQVVIDLAGGISEAISRGERRKKEVFYFATFNCACGDDLKSAAAVLADLRKLTGRQYGERRFAERARALLLANWAAVDALVSALIDAERIEGDQVEKIVRPLLVHDGA